MTPPPDITSPAFRQSLRDLFTWRRDVRQFSTQSVDQKIIDDCLDLAMRAPSVGLSQPWRFIDLQSPERRAKIVETFKNCNAEALQTYNATDAQLYARLKLEGLQQAPCQLAVFCDTGTVKGKKLGQLTMPEMLSYSVVTAIHTFWLAARAHGLGVGWVSILDPQEVSNACDAPPEWQLIAYLCVGWPQETSQVPKLEKAGWESRSPLAQCYSKL